MASPTATQKIRSGFLFQFHDHDPGAATAIVTSADGGTTLKYVDMRDYSNFAAACVTTILGGNGPVLLEIVASADTTFASVTVIKSSGTIAADALADWAIEECTAAEVAQEGADAGVDLRYVAARITTHHAGDEAIVMYFGIPNNPNLDLTPATTIS